MASRKPLSKETIAAHAGMKPEANHGIPNPPVYHASTIMRKSLAEYRQGAGRYDYGRRGTPTTEALEGAVTALYGCDDMAAVPSGMAAVSTGFLAVLKSGDCALLPDSVYDPVRRFTKTVLKQAGVDTVFYDPTIDAGDLEKLITKNTALIYMETPGSMTFEMQDTAAIVGVAKKHGILTACDNTWGTALHFDAVAHGFDIIMEAGTKYISGHSDVMIGFVGGMGEAAKKIRDYILDTGLCVAPDDHYLTMRGLRTMPVRLKQSGLNGIALAEWIEKQPEVIAMRHPALPSHPGHDLWKRDFTGAAGLFGFLLDPAIPDEAVGAFADNLELFGIGASWGGHESLIAEKKITRSIAPPPEGRVMRIYAGLEDTGDLLADIEAGFARMRGK